MHPQNLLHEEDAASSTSNLPVQGPRRAALLPRLSKACLLALVGWAFAFSAQVGRISISEQRSLDAVEVGDWRSLNAEWNDHPPTAEFALRVLNLPMAGQRWASISQEVLRRPIPAEPSEAKRWIGLRRMLRSLQSRTPGRHVVLVAQTVSLEPAFAHELGFRAPAILRRRERGGNERVAVQPADWRAWLWRLLEGRNFTSRDPTSFRPLRETRR